MVMEAMTCILLISPANQATERTSPCLCTNVMGIHESGPGGREDVRVRLHGVDWPERRQPFGNRARQFTGDRALGKTVTGWVRGAERYGCLVGEVILPDGRNLSRELVRAGLACWDGKNPRGDRRLERLEREAKDAKRGSWADPDPLPPWEFRKQAHLTAARY